MSMLINPARFNSTSPPTDPFLAYLPTGFELLHHDAFTVFNVNQDTSLTDAGIEADPGFWGFSNLDYQNPTQCGIPGFGKDWFLNPLSSITPLSSKISNPLGLVSFTAAGQIVFHSRPSTTDELAAIHLAVPSVHGSTTPWVSALLSTRWKLALTPPFACVTKFKTTGVDNGQFIAPDWRMTQRENNGSELWFEIDTVEQFPSTDPLYSTMHEWGSIAVTGISQDIGNYTPTIDTTANWIFVLTICPEDGPIYVKFFDEGFGLLEEYNHAIRNDDPPNDWVDIYNSSQFLQIINQSAGNSWTPSIDPSGDGSAYHMAIGEVRWYCPSTNTSGFAPIAPPADTALVWDPSHLDSNGKLVAAGIPPGTVVASFTGSATSFCFVGGGGTFSVSGSDLVVVGYLDATAYASYDFYIGGAADGSGFGLMPKQNIEISGSFVWWDDNALIDISFQLQSVRSYGTPQSNGSGLGYTDLITSTSNFRYAATWALAQYLPGPASSGTAVWRGTNGTAVSCGLYGSDYSPSPSNLPLGLAVQWDGANLQAKIKLSNSQDYTSPLSGMSDAADPWAVGVSWASGKASLYGSGGSTVNAVTTVGFPSGGASSDNYALWNDGYGDLPYNGLQQRLTVYLNADLGTSSPITDQTLKDITTAV